MSNHKYTTAACLVITVLTLAITVLFMMGTKLGLQPVTTDKSADETGTFSDRDLDGSWDEADACYISLDDLGDSEIESGGAYSLNGDLYIISAGTYVLSGTLTDHQVIVQAKGEKVQLVLSGATLTNTENPPLYVEKADKVFLTLAENTENQIVMSGTLSDAALAEDLDAAVYSAADLAVNGTGSLSVQSAGYHGIKSTDDLIITSGTLTVEAGQNALHGRDSVRICGGTFELTAGNDGIKANNDSNSKKGYVLITDGEFKIEAEHDGIQAVTDLTIEGGVFDILAGDRSAVSQSSGDVMPDGEFTGGRGGMPDGEGGGRMPEMGEAPDGETGGDMPEMGEAPDGEIGGDMPEMGEAPDGETGGDMPEMGEAPDGETGGDMPQMGGKPGAEGDTGMPDESGTDEGGSASDDSSGEDVSGMPDKENMPRRGGKGMDGREFPSDGEAPENMEIPDAAGQPGTTEEAEADSADTGTETDGESDSYKGLKAGNSIVITGGSFTLDTQDDGIHSNSSIRIQGGTITIATGDDGIHGDGSVDIEEGNITVTDSYEGIEGAYITISGGTIDVTASDDGLNASDGSSSSGFMNMGGFGGRNGAPKNMAGDAASDAGSDGSGDGETATDSGIPVLRITGGTLHVDAGGDGLDSNGDLIIDGGTIYIDGPSNGGNGALDSGTESGGSLIVNGGTVLALGCSGMEETFEDTSTQYSFLCNLSENFTEGEELTIADSQGQIVCSYTIAKSGNSIVFSDPQLVEGETYTVTVGDQTEEITLDSISTGAPSGGFGGRGRF